MARLRAIFILAITALGVLQPADAAPRKPAPGAAGQVVAMELRFDTHVGEGAKGLKVFHRNGCFVGETVGGTGGAGKAYDREIACADAAAVADVFKKADELVGAVSAPPPQGGAGGAPRMMPGGRESIVTLILADGSRRGDTAPGVQAQLLTVVTSMPSFPTWYAEAPKTAVGTGPQLIVISARAGSTHLQASLTAGGSWWCHRSVINGGAEPKSPTVTPKALRSDEAAAILRRVLQGISPSPGERGGFTTKRGEISVEAALANGMRAPVTSEKDTETAITRFGAEARKLSAACIPPT